jgi:hypothetical protein
MRHNVCLYHRDHMRFNANLILEVATDIGREAARLKVFADYWQTEPEPMRTPAFDPSHPVAIPAGCYDLSPLSAVASCGILFMEGEGEPEEIRMLKEKLRFRGEQFKDKGQWLVDTMEFVWKHDVKLLDPEHEGAWPWVSVLSLTWRGAKQRLAAGQLLLTARDYLLKIDFTPAGLRKNRAEAGKLLHSAAWTMDAAATMFAENNASLTYDDADMLKYLAYFENAKAA